MPENPMTLDAYGMREMTEFASGVRGEEVYFVATPDPDTPGNYLIVPSPVPVPARPDDVVVPCATAVIQPKRPRVKKVTVTFELVDANGAEHTVSRDVSQYDALFWSESAVEKFLFPYYASKYQWAAAHWLRKMSVHWFGFEPDLGSGLPQAPVSGDEEVTPFAMVHYPRSDYGFESESGTSLEPGGDVHLLRVVEGSVEVSSLAEPARRPEPR